MLLLGSSCDPETHTIEQPQGGGCREGLRVNFSDHPVLLSESAAVGKDCREQVTERMFEGCGAPAIFLAKSAVLSAFALGRQTALVLDIGYEGTIGAHRDWLC